MGERVKYSEIVAMLEGTGLPLAYDHFAEGDAPQPPFLVYLFPSSHNFRADDTVYQKINDLHVELYTDRKQPDVENIVEEALDSQGLVYDKTEVWIAEEQLYEVLYSMEVLYERE